MEFQVTIEVFVAPLTNIDGFVEILKRSLPTKAIKNLEDTTFVEKATLLEDQEGDQKNMEFY